MAVFYSHVEKALRAKATGPVADGRLQGDAPVGRVTAGLPRAASVTGAPYELFAPGAGKRRVIAPAARRSTSPGPKSS